MRGNLSSDRKPKSI